MRRIRVVPPTQLRAVRWLIILAACVTASLSSCGSKTSPSSTTTSTPSPTATGPAGGPVAPPPPDASSITSYLKTRGDSVIAFERATTSLNNGTIPTKATCQSIAKSVSPQEELTPNSISAAIRGISYIPLQVAANEDLQNKLLFIGTCIHGAATVKEADITRNSASVLIRELKELGISI
jgi:hypothetical protein